MGRAMHAAPTKRKGAVWQVALLVLINYMMRYTEAALRATVLQLIRINRKGD